jgi:hypothetical protein
VSGLSPGLAAALAADRATIFGAVEILLPSAAVRLLDGAGFVVIGGNTFLGVDPTFGSLSAVSALSDGSGDQSPALNITIIPPNDTAAATLAAAAMQGSLVSVYLGAIEPSTGLVIADPYLVFLGEIDVPILRSGPDGRTLEYEVVSVMERLFAEDEGQRLSDGFHKSIWPAEQGFSHVTGVENTVYWGVEPPPNAVSYSGTSYSTAGGYSADRFG